MAINGNYISRREKILYLLRFSIESCLQNRKKTVLNLLICMVTVMLLNVFVGNIVSIHKQIEKLPDVIKVNAFISNLNGSQAAGLKIKEKYVDGILTSQYVVKPVFSTPLKMGFGKFSLENYEGKLNYYATGCNSVSAIPGLLEDELAFADGYNNKNFFSSLDRVCVIDENILKSKELSVGNQITLTSFYYRFGDYHDIHIDPLESGVFTIVGTMTVKEYFGEGVQPDIIIPFETVRDIFHKKGVEFTADAGSFQVKNPFELNNFKEEMHELGFLPVAFQSDFDYAGNALTVKDETFIKSAQQLIKNCKLLEGILPFLALAVLCIGFVLAELLMKGRQKEYATMRSLGQSHRESFYVFCLEYSLVAITGSILGIIFVVVLLKISWNVAGIVAVIFFTCYVLGAMVALWSLKRLSVMTVLSKND